MHVSTGYLRLRKLEVIVRVAMQDTKKSNSVLSPCLKLFIELLLLEPEEPNTLKIGPATPEQLSKSLHISTSQPSQH